ncbi:hypothetical protein DFH11DRAFT_214760 [Phellopilus nigrolimitatus]|nr:hypothetical protein DFH11DRAFT_214760 [Phellopilus nigrolimitatus]
MHHHPYANVTTPHFNVSPRSAVQVKHRPVGQKPSSSAVRCGPSAKTVQGVRKVTFQQVQRRPAHKFIKHESGVTLLLYGQKENACVPVYGRGGIVDGIVSFANPASIINVEAKMEGHVTVHELAGHGSAQTAILSEMLLFWDDLDRSAGNGGGPSFLSSSSTSTSGRCPPSFSFKTSLPTHYTEADGERTPLPPSFSEDLLGVPGFKSDVSYSISVHVTQVRDVQLKPLTARWKRHTILRTPFEYRPRSCPSQAPPFPSNSKKSTSSPVTRFASIIASNSPFVEPVKTVLYLPNSQITPLTAPIPFFLRLTGSEIAKNPYSKPHLSSFLPKASSDSLALIASSIQQQISDYLHNWKHSRAFSLPNSRLSALSGASSRTSSNSQESSNSGFNEPPKIRVVLIRQVSVDASSSTFDGQQPNAMYSLRPEGQKLSSQVHKSIVLGEGVMYTTRVMHDSVTWAGEIHIDMQQRTRCSGFRTKNLLVNDMLVVSITQPNPQVSALQELRQVIPIQLTTDAFDSEGGEQV